MGNSEVFIVNSLNAGELAPSLKGRTDLEKYHSGCTTSRNFFSNYRGGVSSRAGLAYVGMCKQQYPTPPKDIPFQFSLNQGYVLEFGDVYMRIKYNGAYVTETTKVVVSVSSLGLFTVSAHGYSVGDWVYDSGNTGFSGLTWIVSSVPSSNTFTLTDLFGSPITSATASMGGTTSRIYTVASPYHAGDLPYLKYTQSADVMTLTCVNTVTDVEYPAYNLTRFAQTNWQFILADFGATLNPPGGLAAVATSSTTLDTWYGYVVTSVSTSTKEESVASGIVFVENNDISLNAGSNTISWQGVSGADSYKVYASIPGYNTVPPVSSLFGFVGTTLGPSFIDTNITPDFTQVPPTHYNPFARGPVLDIVPTAVGSGYTQGSIGYSITTSTGTGFSGTPVVANGEFQGFVINDQGHGYATGDTITITDGGGGTGATATLSVGPETGTYPGAVAYYQQRRVYAASLNQPETYWMSKPGLFDNFDYSIPVSPSDAITGTPWAQQVNGIQYLQPMPGGLVVLTGKGAWQLNGGTEAAITPSSQNAVPQAYNGCHNNVPPIVVNYDILYVQAKGSIVRDLSYNFFVNIYTGTDLTVLSNHLFRDFQIVNWAYAEEPYKLIWLVRDDGILLCLTYLKEQEIYSWTRHDTNGLFVDVCSVTEPTNSASSLNTYYIDATYFIVQRFIQGGWRYYSERMDNRVWTDSEHAYCVDSGLQTTESNPNATLMASASSGTGVSFMTSAPAFDSGMIGDVIRGGGGVATITTYNSSTSVLCNITQPIAEILQGSPNSQPIPLPSGTWGISTPVTVLTGLNHLNGLTVTALADGSVVPNQVVVNNSITLPNPASLVTVGLPYTCQVQTMWLDFPSGTGSTVQNRRKNISAVGVRVEASRGLQIGADQPDQSDQQNNLTMPWTDMNEIKERSSSVNAGTAVPLFTGDYYKTITSGWDLKGQVAIQQVYPLPANVLSLTVYVQGGDDR